MAHELHAPWSCTSTTPVSTSARTRTRSPAVGLHGRAHEVHDPLELGQAIGPLLVAELGWSSSVTPPFCRAEPGRPVGRTSAASDQAQSRIRCGRRVNMLGPGRHRTALEHEGPATAHKGGCHEDPGCVQGRDRRPVRCRRARSSSRPASAARRCSAIIEGGGRAAPARRPRLRARARRLLRRDGAGRPFAPQRLRRRRSATRRWPSSTGGVPLPGGRDADLRPPGDGEPGRAPPQHALTTARPAGARQVTPDRPAGAVAALHDRVLAARRPPRSRCAPCRRRPGSGAGRSRRRRRPASRWR